MLILLDQIKIPYLLDDPSNFKSEIWGNKISIDSTHNTLIIAPSGSGKSSLFQILLGKIKEFSGQIFIDNKSVLYFDQEDWIKLRKNQFSYVFQGLRLLDDLSAFENVQIKNQLTNHKSEEEIIALFKAFNVYTIFNQPVKVLSWGEKQRVAIIRALCQPFSLLILDEPFSHLDQENIACIIQVLEKELSQQKAGLLLFSLGDDYSISWDKKLSL